MLRGMLRKDPSERLTVAAVLSHPWTTRVSSSDPAAASAAASSLQTPGEIEEQEQLAEAARRALREAKLAASEAKRAAAAALAAETNAARALEAVKLAAAATATSRSTARSVGIRPTLVKRSTSSVGSSSSRRHRRSASADSHREDAVAAAATAAGAAEPLRQDHEWSSGGRRERTWSADDSVCAGGGGGGSIVGGAPLDEGSNPPPLLPAAVPAEGGEAAGGGDRARGPGGFIAARASALKRLLAVQAKFGGSQSTRHGGGSGGGGGGIAESRDSAEKPAGRDDGGPVASKTLQRAGGPQEEGAPSATKGAGEEVHRGQSAFERSLSSAFAATSLSDSPAAAVTAPPPIEQSMSFELKVPPAASAAAAAVPPTITNGGNVNGGQTRVSNNPHLVVPDEGCADAAVTPAPAPAAQAREQLSDDVRDQPGAAAVHKIPDTAEAESVDGGDIPSPPLSTTPAMSMNPPVRGNNVSTNSRGSSALSPPGNEEGPPASAGSVLVSPVGAAATAAATAVASAVTADPGLKGRPVHRPEHARSPEPSSVAPAWSPSTSQPSASQPANSPMVKQQQPGNASFGASASAAALAGSRGESLPAAVEGGDDAELREAGPEAGSGSAAAAAVADSCEEAPIPAAGGEEGAASRGAPEPRERAGGEGGVEREVAAGAAVGDAVAGESVDEASRVTTFLLAGVSNTLSLSLSVSTYVVACV